LTAINAELARGTPRLSVARQFGLAETSVRRHFQLHLPEYLLFENEEDRRRAGRELRGILWTTTARLRKQADCARDLRRGRAWLRSVRVLYPLLEIQVRALGRRD
jgi:hypothetical protein